MHNHQTHPVMYLIRSKAIVYFKQVNISHSHPSISQTMLSCLLAHRVSTQSKEGLANGVREVCAHVLGNNFYGFIL